MEEEDGSGVQRIMEKGKVKTMKCCQQNVTYWNISSVNDTSAFSDNCVFGGECSTRNKRTELGLQ